MSRQVKTVTQRGITNDGTLDILESPLTTLSDEYGNAIALDTMLRELLLVNRAQLAILRSINANLQQLQPVMGVVNPSSSCEGDFTDGNEGQQSLG